MLYDRTIDFSSKNFSEETDTEYTFELALPIVKYEEAKNIKAVVVHGGVAVSYTINKIDYCIKCVLPDDVDTVNGIVCTKTKTSLKFRCKKRNCFSEIKIVEDVI
jgi:hypothetical protein